MANGLCTKKFREKDPVKIYDMNKTQFINVTAT